VLLSCLEPFEGAVATTLLLASRDEGFGSVVCVLGKAGQSNACPMDCSVNERAEADEKQREQRFLSDVTGVGEGCFADRESLRGTWGES